MLVDKLRSAGPIDGVLLALHGAMVAEDTDDVEADLLGSVRAIVGSTCPLVATLDLHANLSESAMRTADMLIGYDTYPHADICERGLEAAHVLRNLLQGAVVARAFRKLPLITAPQAQDSEDQPMRSIMDRVHAMEPGPPALVSDGLLGISLCGCRKAGYGGGRV
jgi:microcystin degradation protein MlrC